MNSFRAVFAVWLNASHRRECWNVQVCQTVECTITVGALNSTKYCISCYVSQGWKLTLARSPVRPRRVKFRPGEWFVRPDHHGGRVENLRGFIDHIVIASLALISSGLSRQKEILNRIRLF